MASSVTSNDLFTYLLLIHPVSQLKILHHILRNFDVYLKKMNELYRVDGVNMDAFTLKACDDVYKNIIEY